MRKWIWTGAFAGLAAAGLGVYLGMQASRPIEAPDSEIAEEEFEVPAMPPALFNEWVRDTTPPTEIADAFEPIVVESASPPVVVAAIDPFEEFGVELGLQDPFPTRQPPRPDEEPGQERKMPYAQQTPPLPDFLVRLWDSVRRFFRGEPVVSTQTPEPPVAVEPEPTKPDVLVPLFPPTMNYHQYHGPSCPYTGRCPLPYHPR